jgi:XTP/dITP diphosphohydrolase
LTRQFVLATANTDKAREIAAVLDDADIDVELLPLPAGAPSVDETGETLEDNARLKATALCAATGLPAIADDTGLAVDALDGAPGVRSARFAGEDVTYADNVALLLERLDGVDVADRGASFATVALARWPDGTELVAVGEVRGTIAAVPRGTAGFGYDPVFVPDEGDGRTFAEMSAEEKHRLSHRGRAFRTLAGRLHATPAPSVAGPEGGDDRRRR